MMPLTEDFIVMLIQFERFVEEEEEAFFMPNRLSATPLLLRLISLCNTADTSSVAQVMGVSESSPSKR